MARRKKPEPIEPERYIKGEEKLLVTSSSFLYEIEVFVIGYKRFNLHDTYMIRSDVYKAPGRRTDKVKYQIVHQDYTLIGAPLSWLLENNFIPYKTDV